MILLGEQRFEADPYDLALHLPDIRDNSLAKAQFAVRPQTHAPGRPSIISQNDPCFANFLFLLLSVFAPASRAAFCPNTQG
jgi:hypothetical protein